MNKVLNYAGTLTSRFFFPIKTYSNGTSGQNGGVGRHAVPAHTTKRRTTANIKTKNNQNCQKIELYGSPTTEELKKKYSCRPVGGAEMGSWTERTRGKVVDGEARGPTFACR